MNRRRLIDDMPRRNDLLISNPEIITGIMRKVRPSSPAIFFPSFLGNNVGADESMWEAAPQGLGVGFIRLKEYKDVYEPVRVLRNSLVPAVIVPHQPFEVSVDYALERDENFLTRDEKSYFRVVSSRPTGDGADLTVVYEAMPGMTTSGDQFRVNDPVNHNYGNSKGEGSVDSNTYLGNAMQYNLFFNPMKITRRTFQETGSAMADETEYFAFTLEDEQGIAHDYYTDIPISFFEEYVAEQSRQILYSTANFDPATRRILGTSAQGKYHERPSYAGIYQQLDEVKMIHYHQLRSQNFNQLLATIDEMLRNLYYLNNRQKTAIIAFGKGSGIQVLRDAFRWAINGKFGMSIHIQTAGAGEKIDVGFETGNYITDHGQVILYDMGMGLDKDGEFDKITYQNLSGNPRDWEVYFMPAMSVGKNARKKKQVNLYYRKSSKNGKDVSRGLVFGKVKGITGQNNRLSIEQIQSMQEDSIRQMLNNDSFEVGSTFDGNEYHVLTESVPYIDIDKIQKLQFLPY